MEIIETHELLRVVENFPPVSNFWLSRFFPRTVEFTSEYIDFDTIDKGKRLAPFVAPNVQGQPMLSGKTNIRRFKPAYIKPKNYIDPQRLFIRQAGESFGGSLTPAQREDAIIADTQLEHRNMIERRLEWMAAEAIIKGQVTVAGENYPSVTVSFGRAAANTVTLAGTARWGESADAIRANILAWTAILAKSGRVATQLILGQNASGAFFADTEIQSLLDTRRGSTLTLEGARFQGGAVATLHGVLPGGIEVLTYVDTYEDNDGFEQPFMSPNDIVLAGDPEGVQCFGAIMDDKAGWQAMRMFPKMFRQDDPSGLWLLTQSAPLMVPLRPNATFRATVMG